MTLCATPIEFDEQVWRMALFLKQLLVQPVATVEPPSTYLFGLHVSSRYCDFPRRRFLCLLPRVRSNGWVLLFA